MEEHPAQDSRTRRWGLATALAIAVAHGALFVRAGPVDEDFINFHYARQLAEGFGLVFDPPGRVEGYTAPGWVLLCAATLALGASAPVFAVIAGCVSYLALVLASFAAWRRLRPNAAFPIPCLLLALSTAVAWHAVAGLGTVTTAALVALWAADVVRERPTRAQELRGAAWLGLAMLIRPEVSVLGVAHVACAWWTRRRYLGLASFAPSLAWLAFRKHYYDEWLPVTWKVKKLPWRDDVAFGLEYLRVSTRDCGVLLMLGAVLVYVIARRRRLPPGVLGLALGSIAYTAFVVLVGGDYLALARFFVPILPLLVLLTCLAVSELVDKRVLANGAHALLGLLVVSPLLRRGEILELHDYNERRWLAIGRELAMRAPSGTSVALSPVGAISYESRLRVIDILGRTNDAVWRAPADVSIPMKGHQRFDAAWTLAQRPDLIILGNGVFVPGSTHLLVSAWERTLYEHPLFESQYDAYSVPIRDSYVLAYFQRRGGRQLQGGAPMAGHRRL